MQTGKGFSWLRRTCVSGINKLVFLEVYSNFFSLDNYCKEKVKILVVFLNWYDEGLEILEKMGERKEPPLAGY